SIISSFMVHFSVGYVAGGYLSRRYPRISVLAAFLVVCSLWVILIPAFYKPVCELISDRIADVRLGSLVASDSRGSPPAWSCSSPPSARSSGRTSRPST
ncbi:MAG: hypothetical protein NT047_08235, partial [Deltaproteobacteria bacterium]|nr:hypothetical protein [Deltaproteobacteria bacterium]